MQHGAGRKEPPLRLPPHRLALLPWSPGAAHCLLLLTTTSPFALELGVASFESQSLLPWPLTSDSRSRPACQVPEPGLCAWAVCLAWLGVGGSPAKRTLREYLYFKSAQWEVGSCYTNAGLRCQVAYRDNEWLLKSAEGARRSVHSGERALE